MKKLIFFGVIIFIAFMFNSCDKEKNETESPGSVEINFDNLAVINGAQVQLALVSPGSTQYNYTNGMSQSFNINLLRYFISAVELEGPNGEYYKDEMSVDAAGSKGYYLIDESNATSQIVELLNVPAGTYNKVSFTIGVDSSGVTEGAAGGALDPAKKMFWNWNSGYIAMKFEGQSDVSKGGTSGSETLTADNPKGILYHVGGWKNKPGTNFVYNNKRLSFNFDTNVRVDAQNKPEVHMIFDVLKLFSGVKMIDFTGNNNVHSPAAGVDVANNMVNAFAFDHVHQ